MNAHVLVGSKGEIAQKITEIEGEIHEAIVFVIDPETKAEPAEDIFDEMLPYMVQATAVDDSRELIYARMEGE